MFRVEKHTQKIAAGAYHPSMRWIGSFLSISLLLVQIGCSRLHNERLTLGGSYQPPTIHADVNPITTPTHIMGLFQAPPIDRASWTPMTAVASFDGVTHDPLLRLLTPLGKDNPPRVYGRYPTTSDVLDPQSQSWSADLRLSIEEIGRSTIGSVFAIGYMIWEGELGEPRVSPMPYKRARQDDWASGQPAGQPAPVSKKEQADELD